MRRLLPSNAVLVRATAAAMRGQGNQNAPSPQSFVTLVTSSSGSVTVDAAALNEAIAARLSPEKRLQRLRLLTAQYQQLQDQLKPLRTTQDMISRKCEAHAMRVMAAIGTALAVQFGVLFNWVFFVFDWNLVEPMTYFLGYSATWLSLVFYNLTAKDFTYDSMIEVVSERKRHMLESKHKFDPVAFEALTLEAERLERELSTFTE